MIVKSSLLQEYMPAARSQWGVYAWDPSHAYYKACLKWHLSLEMTPDQVHKLGLQEVERINTEMKKERIYWHIVITFVCIKIEEKSTCLTSILPFEYIYMRIVIGFWYLISDYRTQWVSRECV